jgi:hypothetical protein
VVEAPDLTLAEPSVGASADESQFAADVAAWLREQSKAGDAVFWLLHWSQSSPVAVTGSSHLASLIATLEHGEFAGIETEGNGRWAQVACTQQATRFLELHPYAHDPRRWPFVWDELPDLTVGEAAVRAWGWLRGV